MKKYVFLILLVLCISVHAASGITVSYTSGDQYLPGFITVQSPPSQTGIMVYLDDGTPPTSDTYEQRGNILFFDVLENATSVNIPVSQELFGQSFIVKVGADQTKITAANLNSIISYTLPSGITVREGTPASTLVLPSKIDAVLDTQEHVTVNVIWNTSQYSPTIGTYMIYGQITEYSLSSRLSNPVIPVTVSSASNSGGGSGGGSSSEIKKPTEPVESSEPSAPVLPSHTPRTVRFKIGESRFLLDEDVYMMDTPIIYDSKGDRTLFPVRFLPTALGYDVDWNPDEYKVTISAPDKSLKLHIGSDILHINDIQTRMDTPAVIINDRTYIPLRYVAEALEFDVIFDQETQVVTLIEQI